MDYLYQLINLVKRWSSYFGLASNQNYEDIFYQLLHEKNYDEAIKLALQNKYLDIDLVYKCKWRNSGITVQSINSILAKIQDKLWAINECVQTVPISYEACRTLIEFGIKEANLRLLYQLGNETSTKKEDISKLQGKSGKERSKEKQPSLADNISDDEIEGLIDFDNLNDQQKELCRCRQDLMRHEHSLFTYESILGDYKTVQQHFDHVFYDEFRRKCSLNACIDFAHEGDGHAVEILLNYNTDELAPHLLAILSNFPETLSPYQYRNLLPCLTDQEGIYEWRAISGQIRREEFDWSKRLGSSSSFSINLISIGDEYKEKLYKENETLKKYLNPLTADLLSQWFIERALEMESRTLLLTNAIQLLHLGTELLIKDLKETHDDLIEFDRIVHDCCSEKNMYLSFSEFNQMPEIERLMLMTGDSIKNCRERFRFYVLPYMHKRESKLGQQGKVALMKEYFYHLAHNHDQICKKIYMELLDKIESDTFIAEWTKDLDDVLDEIGEEIIKIERTRESKQLLTMASQTMALCDYNGCYEACQLIMAHKHKDCWTICCQLGMHKDFKNTEAKYGLLAFALAHCDDPDGKMSAKILNYVIELRRRDEKLQLAYLKLNS